MSPGLGVQAAATGFVVDASVAIKLCIQEPLSDKAGRLFDPPGADRATPLHVPDLFYGECANALWKHVRVFGYPLDRAEGHLARILNLGLEGFPMASLAADALRIAVANEISAYDACYVALSERLGLPLVTADERLVRKLEGTAHDVRGLGDIPLEAGPDG